MKEYHTLITDIRTEASELADKLKRLEVFMMSEDFCKISPEQKGLLEQQYDLMAKYKVTLVKRAHRINYEHLQQEAMTCDPNKEDGSKEKDQEPERMEPHVFAAMEYEAHKKRKDRQKVPSAPPTFEVHPEMCATCIHPKGEYSTCHDCENGSNYSKKAAEEEPVEGNYCSTCRYGAECPDGPRCENCDNGSKWMGPKETKRECVKCKHYDRGVCINPHHCLNASEWEAK